MNITEFLLARIAEDEAVAHQANRHYQHVLGISHWFAANSGTSVAMTPRAALAECAAKRRIVEMHREGPGGGYCSRCDREPVWPCVTLRALASVYADHRDYDPAWRDADD